MPSEALRTDAVQIQPVLRGRKSVLADKALLQGFDLRIDDLNALAAALADEMIVILLVHVHGKHSLCQYITLQRGNIVYLFILARYFQTPESDE